MSSDKKPNTSAASKKKANANVNANTEKDKDKDKDTDAITEKVSELKVSSDSKKPGTKKSSQQGKDSAAHDSISPHLDRLNLGPRAIKGKAKKSFSDRPAHLTEQREKLRTQISTMMGNLEEECYRIIFDVFPEKIQKLDSLYKEDENFNKTFDDIYQPVDAPALAEINDKHQVAIALRNVKAPSNAFVKKIYDMLQVEILQMSEMLNSLGIWVKLNVPRISDGNNFGVEVQAEILEELESSEGSGYSILDSFAAYHTARGEVINQILLHPGIEDYRLALKELDEKQYIKATLLACELRNDYISLYDMLAKNLDTLTQPRGNTDKQRDIYM